MPTKKKKSWIGYVSGEGIKFKGVKFAGFRQIPTISTRHNGYYCKKIRITIEEL